MTLGSFLLFYLLYIAQLLERRLAKAGSKCGTGSSSRSSAQPAPAAADGSSSPQADSDMPASAVASACPVEAKPVGSSGSVADVRKQLRNLHDIMKDEEDGVTEADVFKVLGRMQLIDSVRKEVLTGISSWTDDEGVLLVPTALHRPAKRYMATLRLDVVL